MARPSKLTAAVIDEICSAIEDEHAPLETAAEAAGIHQSTLYRWIHKGLRSEDETSLEALLCEGVTRARAKSELKLLKNVLTGDSAGVGFGNSKASAWLLERTRPQRYAQRVNVKVEDAVGKVLDVVQRICSAEDFARILEDLERLDSEGGSPSAAGDPGLEPGAVH